jgi:hypothetical protein
LIGTADERTIASSYDCACKIALVTEENGVQAGRDHGPSVGISVGGCRRLQPVEFFVTKAEVVLATPGAGEAVALTNKYFVVLNTNDGSLSQDILRGAPSISGLALTPPCWGVRNRK